MVNKFFHLDRVDRAGSAPDIPLVDGPQKLGPAQAVALAWQPVRSRPALGALFALDQRLAVVIARAKEPLLAQMRLAWWRDRLTEPLAIRPKGEPLLAAITEHWTDHAAGLQALVDGWEHRLGEASDAGAKIAGFAEGRGKALAAFANLVGAGDDASGAASVGRSWALADFAAHSSGEERKGAQTLAKSEPTLALMSRELRGVAVLGGLSRRALARGEPLMHGRGAALAAIRLGMFGR
jgi:phytoene synthase